jgi:hypothetical protein
LSDDVPSGQRFNLRPGGALAVAVRDVFDNWWCLDIPKGTHAAHLLPDGYKLHTDYRGCLRARFLLMPEQHSNLCELLNFLS